MSLSWLSVDKLLIHPRHGALNSNGFRDACDLANTKAIWQRLVISGRGFGQSPIFDGR